ncbi:MAG: hypothetical protein Sylvanvirus7_18 [Sylvanvirus sp.]|uniref:Uncharacterized protein n=1 Tax=Sylvanvirus sp. TaxID=2487774 RepID=A0A3G5AHS3_9VIRU|nr:MAG: hypothetical protein Sylvanvirus7_18 [Sylvanvirus sp.]
MNPFPCLGPPTYFEVGSLLFLFDVYVLYTVPSDSISAQVMLMTFMIFLVITYIDISYQYVCTANDYTGGHDLNVEDEESQTPLLPLPHSQLDLAMNRHLPVYIQYLWCLCLLTGPSILIQWVFHTYLIYSVNVINFLAGYIVVYKHVHFMIELKHVHMWLMMVIGLILAGYMTIYED